MTTPPVSIHRQADEVEVAALNERGHLERLRALTGRQRRSEHEMEAAERRIPILEAAARTLRWVQRHEAELRERFGLGRGEEGAT